MHLRSARNVIERTNGILKGRFRALSRHRILHYHPVAAGRIIYAACILHNIALADGLNLEEDNIEVPEVVINQEGHGKFYFFMSKLLLTLLFYSTSHR